MPRIIQAVTDLRIVETCSIWTDYVVEVANEGVDTVKVSGRGIKLRGDELFHQHFSPSH